MCTIYKGHMSVPICENQTYGAEAGLIRELLIW